MPLPNTSETSQATTATTSSDAQPPSTPPPAEASRLERLRELLEIEKPGETPSEPAGETHQNAEPPKGAPKGKPKSLKDLAERLSVSDSDLYGVEVPMPNGKPVTLGALKDAHAKQDAQTVRELAFEEKVAATEAQWVRAQRELQTLIASLPPKAVTAEVREKIAAQVAAEAKRERELTLEAIPSWRDTTTREAELAGMLEELKDAGINGEQFFLSASHQWIRFVRNAYLRHHRMTAALAQVTEVKKPSTTGRSAPTSAARKPGEERPAAKSSTLRARVLDVLK